MLRSVAALALGESLLLTGLTFELGWPAACIAAGAQVIPAVLLSEHDKPKLGAK